jgi:histidine triad (HIT) family protein
MPYDSNNIFAKVLKGTIDCQKVFEDEHVLAFKDIFPKAPVHVLVIPKGAYKDAGDFSTHASAEEIVAFTRAIGTIVGGLQLTKTGYRLIANAGVDGGQEVPHFHVHILGGKALGPMV